MTAEILLEIEGEGAVVATEALFDRPELVGRWETTGEDERDGGLATVGVIVGIVGGVMAIAEQIRKWYQEYRAKPGKKLDKVLIITPHGRLLLEDATIEQIAKVLEPLAK
ncbi:MAG: hypothetical protein KME07_07810 [Pegethrix bostrychoides GSE-TBD4-15B]|jgi:hypothetical protein|uniref:Uncharacterized protein n=1 Tax=Pegethrix bostrychoides GSE-TBD4-15B TaxID=2839662 RepID=A0A951U471_9CYAN|nr:hypothetical protein [Pegethrix bostrychoides GSE-TBD4-15B]